MVLTLLSVVEAIPSTTDKSSVWILPFPFAESSVSSVARHCTVWTWAQNPALRWPRWCLQRLSVKLAAYKATTPQKLWIKTKLQVRKKYNLKSTTFKIFLFFYLSFGNLIHLYSEFWSHPSTTTLPSALHTVAPNFMASFLYLLIILNQVSATLMCMSVWSTTGAWPASIYQGEMTLPNSMAIKCQCLLH